MKDINIFINTLNCLIYQLYIGNTIEQSVLGLMDDSQFKPLKEVPNFTLNLFENNDLKSTITTSNFAWKNVGNDACTSAMGDCWVIASSLLDKKYGSNKSNLDPNNSLDSIRAVAACVRNAFSHRTLHPEWYFETKNGKISTTYQEKWIINVDNDKIEVDLRNKHGVKLEASDFKGYHGVLKIFEEIKKHL